MPQKAAGMRTLPAPSVPTPIGPRPAATAAAGGCGPDDVTAPGLDDAGAEQARAHRAAAQLDHGTAWQQDLHVLQVDDAERYLADCQFAAGSMGPKIRAAIDLMQRGGKEVIITSPTHLEEAMAGKTFESASPSARGGF